MILPETRYATTQHVITHLICISEFINRFTTILKVAFQQGVAGMNENFNLFRCMRMELTIYDYSNNRHLTYDKVQFIFARIININV